VTGEVTGSVEAMRLVTVEVEERQKLEKETEMDWVKD
jgi:hypothetical protein